MKKNISAISLSMFFGCAIGACPSWPTSQRFTIVSSEVTDNRTGLIWQRCSVGQIYNGISCSGSASNLSHEQALVASQVANSGEGATNWRLPNVKELASLADRGCQNPSIDSVAFPATQSNSYWSSTPYLISTGGAWLVGFDGGTVGYDDRNRSIKAHIRLVRSSP